MIDLAKASPQAEKYLSKYAQDPTGARQHVGIDQRVSDRDRYMDLATRRGQTGALTGSTQGVLDKFRANAAGSIGANVKGGMHRAGLVEQDISQQRNRGYEAEGLLSDIATEDALQERKLDLTKNQIDAQKKAEKMKKITDLGGSIMSGFGANSGGEGSTFWGNLASKFGSSGQSGSYEDTGKYSQNIDAPAKSGYAGRMIPTSNI